MTGEQVKEIRKKYGLNRTEFAARIGVSENTAYRWEAGKAQPSPLAEARIREWSELGEKFLRRRQRRK